MDFDGLGLCFSFGRWCYLCAEWYFHHGISCIKVWVPFTIKGCSEMNQQETGEMGQWLRALIALTEDLGSVLSTHMGALAMHVVCVWKLRQSHSYT